MALIFYNIMIVYLQICHFWKWITYLCEMKLLDLHILINISYDLGKFILYILIKAFTRLWRISSDWYQRRCYTNIKWWKIDNGRVMMSWTFRIHIAFIIDNISQLMICDTYTHNASNTFNTIVLILMLPLNYGWCL